MAEEEGRIQGYEDGLFWVRNVVGKIRGGGGCEG